jgi:hypothetical protein
VLVTEGNVDASGAGVTANLQWRASCHAEATALHRAINELARALAHWHFDGDGCLDPDRPPLRLGGAAVITPGETPAAQDTYRTGCERLGVAPWDAG